MDFGLLILRTPSHRESSRVSDNRLPPIGLKPKHTEQIDGVAYATGNLVRTPSDLALCLRSLSTA